MATEANFIAPPNSKESEMMVLGCMLNNNNELKIAADALDGSDFYFTEHKTIFQALKSLHTNGKPADVHIVCEKLKQKDMLKAVGGAAYVTTLAQYAGTSAYIEEYVEELKNLSMRRLYIQAAAKMQDQLFVQENHLKVIQEFQKSIKQIEEQGNLQDKFPIKCIADLGEKWFENPPQPKKMLFEYSDEQGAKQGFMPKGNVCMLVGMGGIGKSHWISQLSVSLATETLFLDMLSPTYHSHGSIFLGLAENDIEDIRRLLFKASKYVRNVADHKKELTKVAVDSLEQYLFPFSFQGHQCQFIKDGEPSPYFYQLKQRLISCAPQIGWSLIILDPISRFLSSEAESDNASATAFIALMEQLAIDLPGNPTILFCHHMNKGAISGNASGQEASRGSSALTDGVRLQINLRRPTEEEKKKIVADPSNNNPDEIIIMTMSKSNFTAILKDVHLQKENDGYIRKNSGSRQIPLGKK